MRREPDRVDAERLEVWQFLNQATEVSDAVAVIVLERRGVHLRSRGSAQSLVPRLVKARAKKRARLDRTS